MIKDEHEDDDVDEKMGGIGVAGFGGGTMEETPAGTVGEAVDELLEGAGGANIAPSIPPGSMVPDGEGKSQNLKRCVMRPYEQCEGVFHHSESLLVGIASL